MDRFRVVERPSTSSESYEHDPALTLRRCLAVNLIRNLSDVLYC